MAGAAAAPNTGITTIPSLVFIMTFLNIRLNYWLPNPFLSGTHPGIKNSFYDFMPAPFTC